MTCHKILLLLSDYIDGTLTARQAAAVRSHLERCRVCRGEWQALRAVLRLTEYYGRERCPVDISENVLAAIRTPAEPARRRLTAWWMAGPVAVAACAMWLTVQFSSWLPAAPTQYRTGHYSGYHAVAGPSEPEIAAPVHTQYRYTTSLGATDGLLLSLSAGEP